MPVVKGDRIGESNGLNACSIEAQDFYARLIATAPDDFGRFRAVPLILAGKLYPRREPNVAMFNRIRRMLDELERAGQFRCWETDGVRFAELVKWKPTGNRWHKTPEPPWDDSAPHRHGSACIGTAARCF